MFDKVTQTSGYDNYLLELRNVRGSLTIGTEDSANATTAPGAPCSG